ncbi:MAG: hypothetical protein PHQ66_00960 [Candidatus Nanoarchaeia archaeon]|nr:hypothetical protein [Candidatus Nanoarchaeia archaeon]MDD5358048.1 hypothetical protein [Candidatus Nanoarchaeia archaeon]MDD5588967.1 hypothetical protein [Candidatus Nanoarchaeia archaeon]
MSLTKKILAAALTISSLGCTTVPERNFPEGHIYNTEYSKVDETKVPFDLAEHSIYDKIYYLQETAQIPNSLPMLFYPWDKTQRELDIDSKTIKLNSTEMYLPELVIDGTGKKDKWADWITLRNSGIYGTRAYMTSLEELKRRRESENDMGYKVITTEEDAIFALPTMKILNEEYFVILVEDKKINEKEKLPFYMTPVRGAKIRMDNSCGNLTIYNENQIYRPRLIKDFNELNRMQTQEIGSSTAN